MAQSSETQLGNIISEGLTFEAHADLDCSKNPLIFIEILDDQNALLSAKFATDPVSLRKTAEFLLFTADRAENKYREFWRNKANA